MKSQQNELSRFTKTAYSLGIIAAILMVVNVIMSARLSQDGLAIDALSNRSKIVKEEMRAMDQQLLAKTSLYDLSEQAQKLNYVTPTSVVTVYSSDALALRQ